MQPFLIGALRKETSFLTVDEGGAISWEERQDMATGRDEHGCSQVVSINVFEKNTFTY